MEISDTFVEQFSIASLVSVVVIGGLSFYSYLGQTSTKPRAQRNYLTVGGLINDGNTCFMNSVIQAFCSLKKFQEYINSQEYKGPVTTALQKLIDNLSIRNEQVTLRPSDLVQKMSRTAGGIRHLLGYQQQDAQEFFQYLSSLVSNEQAALYKTKLTILDPSFMTDSDHYALFGTKKISWKPTKKFHSPLTGLLASGIFCKVCKHQTTLQHNTFDNLALPIYSNYFPSVHSMIKSYTSPELIEDYICEKCSLIATIENSEYMLKSLAENRNSSNPNPGSVSNNISHPGSVSKKSRDKSRRKKNKASKEEYQLRKSIEILKQALNTQDFDIKMPEGITKVKISSPCEKQTILACPPVCLCLHMQRSMVMPSGRAVKNNSPVNYEETLDINDLVLGTEKQSIISKIGAAFEQHHVLQSSIVQDRGLQPKDVPSISAVETDTNENMTLMDDEDKSKNEEIPQIEEIATIPEPGPFIYRLSAVILHYGNHDSGHFVTLRRDISKDMWFRVSDANVEKIVDVEQEVFVHGSRYAYMIFYERIK